MIATIAHWNSSYDCRNNSKSWNHTSGEGGGVVAEQRYYVLKRKYLIERCHSVTPKTSFKLLNHVYRPIRLDKFMSMGLLEMYLATVMSFHGYRFTDINSISHTLTSYHARLNMISCYLGVMRRRM